jgi:hypothetical protein
MCATQILSCCYLASLVVTSFGGLVLPPHVFFTSLGAMRLDPPLSCFFMYDFQTMLVILCYFVWMLMFNISFILVEIFFYVIDSIYFCY